MQACEAEIAANERACKTKCKKMTLANHGTAFNALKDLGEEHVTKLKAKGYNTNPSGYCMISAGRAHSMLITVRLVLCLQTRCKSKPSVRR